MVGTKKSLGQHWLKNRKILDEIAKLAVNENITKNNNKSNLICLEIGPGLGTLTSSLLKCFTKVIAVEYDTRLAKNLPKSFPGKNLEVLNEDILEFDFSTICEKYIIAGNIPYYITSPILEKILSSKNQPEKAVLLIQKEVAERILSEKATVLSLFVKNRAEVQGEMIVPRAEFSPAPKVDSQVIVLKPYSKPKISNEVFELIKRGFVAPRKKLIHNLTNLKSKEELKEIFVKLRIDVNSRPSDLALKDWEKLYIGL